LEELKVLYVFFRVIAVQHPTLPNHIRDMISVMPTYFVQALPSKLVEEKNI
jgi:hypothetical protein